MTAPTIDPLIYTEQAVLGALLEAPHTLEQLPWLTGAHFHTPRHATIYQVLHDLIGQDAYRGPTDLLQEILKRGCAQTTGGAPYLHTLLEAAGTIVPAMAPHLAERMREAHTRRRVHDLGTKLQQLAGANDLDHALDLAANDVLALVDDTAQQKPKAKTRYLDGAAFILNQPDTTPAVWGEHDRVLWAEGEALVIVGPTGVGKSTLTNQLVLAAIGIRRRVLDLPVRPARKVLYLASDRPPQIARSFARMVDETHRDTLVDKLLVWKGPPPADLARDTDALAQMCTEAGADVVILDSLKDMAVKLSDDEIGAGLNIAIQKTLVAGTDVAAIHHPRKPAQGHKEPGSIEDVYGSTWITAGAGSVISLWGQAGDLVINMRHLKQPAAEVGPWQLIHDHDTGTTEIHSSTDLITVIAHSGIHGITPTGAASVLFPKTDDEKPTKNEVEKARRALERLVRDGKATRTEPTGAGRGQEMRYHALTTDSTSWGDDAR